MVNDESLVKKQKFNIFQKIKKFFNGLFSKNNNCESNVQNNLSQKERKNRIIKTQTDYENGTIKETDLSDLEKEELLLLYNEQIDNLEEKISNYQEILENYKAKILKKREEILKN